MSTTGALIMGTFATIWWIVGLTSAGHGATLVYLPPVVVAVLLAGAMRQRARGDRATPDVASDAQDAARRDRVVMWASAAEGLALFVVAGVVLPSTGHRELTAPAIALIVGAHFVPLAHGLPVRSYYATAAALIALGLAGLALPDLATRVTVVSAGAASILWLTSAMALRRGSGARSPEIRSPAA